MPPEPANRLWYLFGWKRPKIQGPGGVGQDLEFGLEPEAWGPKSGTRGLRP